MAKRRGARRCRRCGILSEWAGLGFTRARTASPAPSEVRPRVRPFSRNGCRASYPAGPGRLYGWRYAAIALGERVPVVDTNVRRVVARLDAHSRSRSSADIAGVVAGHTPADRPGDFAQAMMDLGATICRPKDPDATPARSLLTCLARASGTPEAFPAAKAKRCDRIGTQSPCGSSATAPSGWSAAWPKAYSAAWRRCRPATGWLCRRGQRNRRPRSATCSRTSRSTFTSCSPAIRVGDGWWQPLERIDEAGLPTLYRRAAHLALGLPHAGPPAA